MPPGQHSPVIGARAIAELKGESGIHRCREKRSPLVVGIGKERGEFILPQMPLPLW